MDNGELGAYGEYIKKYRGSGDKLEPAEAEARLKLAIAANEWLRSEAEE